MAVNTAFMAEISAMERESVRKGYPEAFPAMPEIPGGRYFDQRFYDLELKYIWHKTWLYACHISEIPDTGSFFVFDKLGLSVILARARDGSIHAMHNVCRHRGAPVVQQKSGRQSRFVCPYHAWSYNLDGSLAVVPGEHNFACLDKTERSLLKVKCEVWRGFVFINLDDEAGPLEEFLAPVIKKVEYFPLEKMRVWRNKSFELNCNWKAALDNFIEIYHIPTVHGKTAMNWLRPETFWISPMRNGHSCLTTERRIDNEVDQEQTAKLLHGPLPDTAPVVPGADPFFHDHALVIPIFPNLLPGGFNPGGFPLQRHWPSSPGKTIIEISILGWEEEDENSTYWDALLADLMTQVDEDIDILNSIQGAIESGYYTGAVLSFLERAIYWYHEEIDKQIGFDRVPEDLAIKRVLAPYFEL